MGVSHVILKPDPDQDLYAVWITGVDGPSAWGPRADIEIELANPVYGDNAADPERFARADRRGTSAIDVSGPLRGCVVYSPPRPDGRPGWIDREHMAAWLHSGLDPNLLEPIEDEEPING